MQNHTPKICLIGHSLATGGAERAMASLSLFFAAKGIDVQVVTVVSKTEYAFGGKHFDLGRFSRLQKFLQLRKFLHQNKFDFIIDFRMRQNSLQEWFTARVLYNASTVYTIHSAKLDWYLPSTAGAAFAVYGHAYGMVAVGDGIAKLLERYRFENLATIPNPLDIDFIRKSADEAMSEPKPYVLAVGRMDDDVKQFDKLIDAYAKSNLPEKNIRLVILGDGILREALETQAERLGLSDKISLDGAVNNPYPHFKNAMFTILSSKTEGLPTVILESLCLGTPVVSFDCKTGPAELIRNRENGLLVEDQDFEKLISSMEEMASDEALRQYCKQNATAGTERYALENIGRQWIDFLKIKLS